MSRFRKPVFGAFVGATTAGGWLIMDLMLPDPEGDYFLFSLMAIVNAAVGWNVVKMLNKKPETKDTTSEKWQTESN